MIELSGYNTAIDNMTAPGNYAKPTPLTLEELKEPLTPAERQEMDNPLFIRQLNLFIEGLNSIQDLSASQRYAMMEALRDHAKRRTEVNQAILDNPAVAKTEINPVVIIGLPRSGTTMLHRLLSCDPRFVAPMAFEMLQPCPPGRPENSRETERYRKAQDYWSHIFPGGVANIQHIHEMNLELQEECQLILQQGIMDHAWSTCESFRKLRDFIWHFPQDIGTEVYEYYKKALKCIFYNGLNDGHVPLLKAPFHTLYIETYKKVFPNAKFIFPFRNVKNMFASCCSMLPQAGIMTGLKVTKEYSKEYSEAFFKIGTSRVINAMKAMPKDTLFAVSYSKMVKDPLDAVKDIYTNFGWTLTPEALDNMQRHIQENKQHKLGKHSYNLEEIGVTEDELKNIMADYVKHFGSEENLF